MLAVHGLPVKKATQLSSEMDSIWKLTLENGERRLLRISAPVVTPDRIAFENELLSHLAKKKLECSLPALVSQPFEVELQDEASRVARLFSWVEGTILADWMPHSSPLFRELGRQLGEITHSLQDFDHPKAHQSHSWKIDCLPWIEENVRIFSGERRDLVERTLEEIGLRVVPLLPELRESVCYHDANDHNILIQLEQESPTLGFIDFGDACHTKTCLDAAIACAYLMMGKPDPVAAAMPILEGFHESLPLDPKELLALPGLIKLRLLISLTHSTIRQGSDPENKYNQVSNAGAWQLLEDLDHLSYHWIHYCFRHACGYDPVPHHSAFSDMLSKCTILPMFKNLPSGSNLPAIDLSVGSEKLGTQADIDDGTTLDHNIKKMLWDGMWGIGRYAEPRSVYTADNFAQIGNGGRSWRSIHLGVDLFAPAGTALFAPLDAIVHSVRDNAGYRNYGPTLILKITAPVEFYLLFGHLSSSILETLSLGQIISAGQEIGQVGAATENGGWTPHLHLQIVRDPLQLNGDYPGAATPQEWMIWQALSPNPACLLGLQDSQTAYSPVAEKGIVENRVKYLPQNLSLSYQRPLHIVRGSGAFLVDAQGQKYLDMVNNVAHVGHEHPRVVAAGQSQMALLNTNTRYLHRKVVECAEYLASKMPPALEVVYFCNSGSEANELAMRIARTVTGRKNILALESGYHGHTGACIDVSSYKFAGAGGAGKPDHVEIMPLPDPYRRAYASSATRSDYSRDLRAALDRFGDGRIPSAFIHESILSCGGQIMPPPEYFSEIYRTLKRNGVLTIADEVQTGVGRVGHAYWAFELHDIVPDIITIGKPFGNGHPLAAVVTTRDIADAFANGMEYFNTFGGNPVSATIGLEVLKIVDEQDLQAHAAQLGDYLLSELRGLQGQYPFLGDVRGSGLFLGIEFIGDVEKTPSASHASYVVEWMKQEGILLSTDGPDHNVIKIKPPMVFSQAHADYFLEKFSKTLQHNFLQEF